MSDSPYYLISDLIQMLVKAKEQHGDLPVVINRNGINDTVLLTPDHVTVGNATDESPSSQELRAEYSYNGQVLDLGAY